MRARPALLRSSPSEVRSPRRCAVPTGCEGVHGAAARGAAGCQERSAQGGAPHGSRRRLRRGCATHKAPPVAAAAWTLPACGGRACLRVAPCGSVWRARHCRRRARKPKCSRQGACPPQHPLRTSGAWLDSAAGCAAPPCRWRDPRRDRHRRVVRRRGAWAAAGAHLRPSATDLLAMGLPAPSARVRRARSEPHASTSARRGLPASRAAAALPCYARCA